MCDPEVVARGENTPMIVGWHDLIDGARLDPSLRFPVNKKRRRKAAELALHKFQCLSRLSLSLSLSLSPLTGALSLEITIGIKAPRS